MKITLAQPKEQVIVPQQVKTITSLTIQRMVDIPTQKVVKVFTQELNDPIILWSGATYDAAGQWTDSQVMSALTAMFS